MRIAFCFTDVSTIPKAPSDAKNLAWIIILVFIVKNMSRLTYEMTYDYEVLWNLLSLRRGRVATTWVTRGCLFTTLWLDRRLKIPFREFPACVEAGKLLRKRARWASLSIGF